MEGVAGEVEVGVGVEDVEIIDFFCHAAELFPIEALVLVPWHLDITDGVCIFGVLPRLARRFIGVDCGSQSRMKAPTGIIRRRG